MKSYDELLNENQALAAQAEFLRSEIEFSATAIIERHPSDEIHAIACEMLETSSMTTLSHLCGFLFEVKRSALKPLRDEWEKKDAHEVSAEEKLERLVGMLYKSTETI